MILKERLSGCCHDRRTPVGRWQKCTGCPDPIKIAQQQLCRHVSLVVHVGGCWAGARCTAVYLVQAANAFGAPDVFENGAVVGAAHGHVGPQELCRLMMPSGLTRCDNGQEGQVQPSALTCRVGDCSASSPCTGNQRCSQQLSGRAGPEDKLCVNLQSGLGQQGNGPQQLMNEIQAVHQPAAMCMPGRSMAADAGTKAAVLQSGTAPTCQ